jgi:hypothetical protein
MLIALTLVGGSLSVVLFRPLKARCLVYVPPTLNPMFCPQSVFVCLCVSCDAVDVLHHSAGLCNGDAQRTSEIFYILDESFVSSITLLSVCYI